MTLLAPLRGGRQCALPRLSTHCRHTTRRLYQARVLCTSTTRNNNIYYNNNNLPRLINLLRRRPQFVSSSFLDVATPTLPLPAAAITTPTTLLMTTQKRGHAGHGHGQHHHHHHDNVYLTSKNKNDAGVRITRVGLLVNLAMAIGKFLGGYIFHSQALVADAYHALTDMVSDFMTLGTVAWSLKPPSERFPNGYGKVESLGALGVSSLLLCGGVFMGLNAGQVLLSQFYPEAFEALQHAGLLVHGHSHGNDHGTEVLGPNINAAWLAAGSIVVKEWLYHATMKIAKERKSSVLASNAMHHRIDSLTSIVALATIGGAHIFNNASWLDPVGGLVISLMVIQAGWGNTKTALLELADTTIDNDIKDSVRRVASKTLSQVSAPGEVELRDIQGMKSGQNYLMEIEVAVPGSWTVHQFRQLEGTLREAVGSKVRGVRRVKVRAVPQEVKDVDFTEEFIPGDVSPRSSPEPEENENNHQQNGNGVSHSNKELHKRR